VSPKTLKLESQAAIN